MIKVKKNGTKSDNYREKLTYNRNNTIQTDEQI